MVTRLETKYMDEIYFESSENNEILISYNTDVSLGTITTITTNKIIKTDGLELLTNLSVGQSIKINDEIKRVSLIEDDDTFYVSRDFKDTHSVGDTIYKDFSNNDSRIGSLYLLEKDNFENQIVVSDLLGGIFVIDRCTQFTNLSSLFITTGSGREDEECFITGTFNLGEGDLNNIVNPFICKQGKTAHFILDMEDSIEDLDDDGKATVTGLNSNIHNIKLNGNTINFSDWLIDDEVITITNTDLLRGNFDYIEVLHYPSQKNYITDKLITVRLGLYSYDSLLVFDETYLEDLNHMCLRTDFNSQVTYEFYDINNKDIKQKDRTKTGINSTLTITSRISENSDDDKLIQRHLQYYIENLDNFRIIRKVPDVDNYEFYSNARLIEGTSFSEGAVNTYTYTIEFLQRTIVSPNIWGEKRWGYFYWGMDKIVSE